jgi:hypothetical protein
MRTFFLSYWAIFSLFILSLSSCINHDFDLNDKYLDNNVTFGDSTNIPIGSIQRISIYEELQKVYDQIKVGDDQILYVGYDDSFPVEFPDYEIPTVEKLETPTSITNLDGTITIPSEVIEIALLQNISTEYEMERPTLIDETDLTITAQKVKFNSFTIKAGFELSGIDFTSVGNDAKLTVSLMFPANYSLKNPTDDYTIKSSVYIKDIIGKSYCSLDDIEVDSYIFDDGGSELIYNVTLEGGGSPITLTANDPIFTLILECDNQSIDVKDLECFIDGSKTFTGFEDGFGDLQSAFGEDNTLEFKAPSIGVNLTTNLGSDFKLDINMSKENVNAYLNSPLLFEKPAEGSTKITPHTLNPENFANLDRLISTPFPEKLDYIVRLIFDNQKAKLLSPDQLTLTTDYSFKIPFDFKTIDLTIKDTITDLFDKDIYDLVFSHTKKNVSIEADLVDISIEGINLAISAAILDAEHHEIFRLDSKIQDQTPNLIIAIEGDNLEKMKNARHLEFSFRLLGNDTAIKDNDYIKIDGLRIVSGSGIHFEL